MSKRGTKLPEAIKPVELGLNLFCQWKVEPCDKFAGLSFMDLFAGAGPFIDLDRVWVVGSCAWQPIIKGTKWDGQSDVDIIFPDQDQAEAFRDRALELLNNNARPQRRVVEGLEANRFGGTKLFWTKPRTKPSAREEVEDREFMDIIWLPPSGRTVAEVISEFNEPHEKVAINAAAAPGDVNSVIRLAYPWKHEYWQPTTDAVEHRKECYACQVDHREHLNRAAWDGS